MPSALVSQHLSDFTGVILITLVSLVGGSVVAAGIITLAGKAWRWRRARRRSGRK